MKVIRSLFHAFFLRVVGNIQERVGCFPIPSLVPMAVQMFFLNNSWHVWRTCNKNRWMFLKVCYKTPCETYEVLGQDPFHDRDHVRDGSERGVIPLPRQVVHPTKGDIEEICLPTYLIHLRTPAHKVGGSSSGRCLVGYGKKYEGCRGC